MGAHRGGHPPGGRGDRAVGGGVGPKSVERPAALARLRNALALVIGTQATIALTDVCNLDTDQAHELALWITDTLVRETLKQHP